MATADLTRRTAGLMLAQHPDNLLFCKPFPFHHKFSFPKSPQENSLSQWPGFRGKGQACGDLIERISYRDVTEEVLKSISGWHAGGVGLA